MKKLYLIFSKKAMGQYARFKLCVTYPGVAEPKDLPVLETIKLLPTQ